MAIKKRKPVEDKQPICPPTPSDSPKQPASKPLTWRKARMQHHGGRFEVIADLPEGGKVIICRKLYEDQADAIIQAHNEGS